MGLMPMTLCVIVFVSAFMHLLGVKLFTTDAGNVALPPGPPTIPVVGNLLRFPKKWPHYQFTAWGEYSLLIWSAFTDPFPSL